jgi:hypothetical protein
MNPNAFGGVCVPCSNRLVYSGSQRQVVGENLAVPDPLIAKPTRATARRCEMLEEDFRVIPDLYFGRLGDRSQREEAVPVKCPNRRLRPCSATLTIQHFDQALLSIE